VTSQPAVRRRVANEHHRASHHNAGGDSSGFTLIEVVVSMTLLLIVVSLLPSILATTTTATSSARAVVTGAAQAELAMQNLGTQVASASQMCLPTQLTAPKSGTPLTAASGFALRIEQVTSASTSTWRWKQWQVNTTSGLLQEDRYTPGTAGGGWVTVATGISNSTVTPFTSTPNPGLPQELSIDLQVKEHPGRLSQTLEIRSAVSAFSMASSSLPTTPACTTTSAAPTS
jgi:prepilin-type N-terminal cleavage/methylation domain-containing protein